MKKVNQTERSQHADWRKDRTSALMHLLRFGNTSAERSFYKLSQRKTELPVREQKHMNSASWVLDFHVGPWSLSTVIWNLGFYIQPRSPSRLMEKPSHVWICRSLEHALPIHPETRLGRKRKMWD